MSYTYLIGWTHLNKWYYGVRYASGCYPDELWKRYFTSSKHVKRFRIKNGEPNVIKIRKVFETKHDAILWEQKVLRRINVERDVRFLNVKNSTTGVVLQSPNKTSFKKGNVPWNKGLDLKEYLGEEWTKRYSREKSEEEKLKLSNSNKERFANADLRAHLSYITKEKFANLEFKEYHLSKCVPHSDKIWINDGYSNKRVRNEIYLSDYPDWERGRIISSETLLKMKKGREHGN